MVSERHKEYKSRNKSKNSYSSRKVLFLLLICCAGAAYLVWIRTGGYAIPCMFREVTGLLCPGCGVTRMIRAVSELDFETALQANAFLFITSPYLLALLIYSAFKWVRNERTGAKTEAAAAVYCVGLIVFGIVRNLIR